MNRERLTALLRWAGMAAAGGVLAVALSARGPQSRGTQAIGLAAPGASSPLIAQTLSNIAASGISGPYVVTAKAYTFDGDVRSLPPVPSLPQIARPEGPEPGEERLAPAGADDAAAQPPRLAARPSATMPSPIQNFAGLSFLSSCTGGRCGSGYPPDTNGDVGPSDYVETVNTAVGIFSKTGTPLAAFTFNSLFSAAGTGTACDTANQGDPVALYDAQSNRFLVSDFAFTSTQTGPFFECLAVSKTGDPTGQWWMFALPTDLPTDAVNLLSDYPKLGVWPDGIYLSANMFDCHVDGCVSTFINAGARVWALNRAELINGLPLHAVAFDAGSAVFTALPSNVRGAAPPAGTPNYFVSVASLSSLDVFKFHVDFTTPANSTFTGPAVVNVATFASPPLTVTEPSGANNLDTLGGRLMMQNQYRNISGAESLWVTHTAGKAAPNITGVRWYQLNVTGGTISTTPVQQSTYRPDADNRWLPSLAVDKFGNMAIGYSVASGSLFPAIRYAGRLAGDPASTLGQDETTLVAGTGGQTNDCGGNPCIRWGDYSAMTVDPVDDCTFWYTNEYYDAADGANWLTRIGSFRFPTCGAAALPNRAFLPAVMNVSGASATTLLQEGFEGAWPSAGWTLADNNSGAFDWGKRNCQVNSGSFGGWVIGGGSQGAGLGCGSNYINNAQIWMIHDPISLVGATAAQFNLQVSVNTATSDDNVCRLASVDQTNFFGICTSGNTGGFVPKTLDLSKVPGGPLSGSFLGQPNVSVAVLFESGSSGVLPGGAFVDDLQVQACLAASCTSQGNSPAGPAGSGHEVAVKLTRPGR